MSHAWLRAAGALYLHRQVRRNLGTVQGLEHIPAQGAFVITPNHTSYLDHFILDFLLGAVRDRETWFLTKAESFEKPLSRAWASAWHGIPVDRERPGADTLRAVQSALESGAAVCVYPEGTRNPDPDSLLEFKGGAFHFAATSNVPIVPVAIRGADHVLARGERRFRRGRIDVRFGPPLHPDTALKKPQRVATLLAETRRWMEAAVEELRKERGRDRSGVQGLTPHVTALMNRGALTRRRRRALASVISTMERSDPRAAGPIRSRARLSGLRAMTVPALLRPLLFARAESALRHSLRIHPSDAEAHYYLGRALAHRRGRSDEARAALETAVRLTSRADPRPLISLAELEARAGERDRTQDLLAAADRVLDEDDERTPLRRKRISDLRAGIGEAA